MGLVIRLYVFYLIPPGLLRTEGPVVRAEDKDAVNLHSDSAFDFLCDGGQVRKDELLKQLSAQTV